MVLLNLGPRSNHPPQRENVKTKLKHWFGSALAEHEPELTKLGSMTRPNKNCDIQKNEVSANIDSTDDDLSNFSFLTKPTKDCRARAGAHTKRIKREGKGK